MSLEREVKEAFERRADDVTPRAAAWLEVERRVRRSHSRRIVAATALAAAAVAAAVVAVPRLVNDAAAPGPGFSTQVPSPSPRTTPLPPGEGRLRYVDERLHVQVDYPADWHVSEFEAVVELQPPGLPSFQTGEPSFAVTLSLEAGSARPRPVPSGAQSSEGELAGQHYVRSETTGELGHEVTYVVEWTGSSETLTVRLIAGSESLWSEWSSLGEEIVGSLAPPTYSGEPLGVPITTRRGTIEQGIAYDEQTSALVRFLEARIEGVGAEGWLHPDARRQFDAREGGLALYGEWTSYEVGSRPVSGGNSKYAVAIGGRIEEIWIGRVDGVPKVLSAAIVSG